MKVALFIIVLLAAVAGYLYYNPELRREWFEGTPLAPAPTVTHLYKWQDETGAWHVTDTPPPSGTRYERLELHSDTNVMPLYPRD